MTAKGEEQTKDIYFDSLFNNLHFYAQKYEVNIKAVKYQ